jgi:diguanylate cyclase (GGDEF)-like protein/PAS domain S-box-containing protein
MSPFWQALLSNMAVVIAVVSLWTNIRGHLPASMKHRYSLTFGAVMGIGAILSMLMHFEAEPGLITDMRAPLLAIAGFYGGPLAALTAGVLPFVYRIALGGFGVWAGALGILAAIAIGLAGRRLIAHRAARDRDIFLLAAATAASSAASLLALPYSKWELVVPLIFGPAPILIFAATLLAGFAVLQDNRMRALMRANMIYRAIIETLPDCLNSKNLQGQFTAANSATAKLMRVKSSDDLIGKTDFDFFPSEIARRFKADEDAVIASGAPITIEQQAAFDDGTLTWISTLKAPIRDDDGALIGLITHNRDIGAQKRLQEGLRIAHQRLEDALEHMADGLVLYDRNGVLLLCNKQYRRLFPDTSDLRVPGALMTDIIRGSIARGEQIVPSGAKIEAWIEDHCRTAFVGGDRMIHLKGDRWIEARTRIVGGGGSLILLTDMTSHKRAKQALALANSRLERLALTDGLTGLTNRRGFDQAFEKEFARAARDRTPLGLLLVDLDRFKAYNDTYGHQSGDECLQLISKELQTIVRRPADVVARYGGEELVAILPNTPLEGAAEVAETFRKAVKKLKLAHGGDALGVVTVSVGVTSHVPGKDIERPEDLLRRADKALYLAKSEGRNRVSLDVLASPSAAILKLADAS